MRKVLTLLVRDPDLTHDEFASYLREEPAPLAEDLSGVEAYSISLPADPERAVYDGVAELYLAPDESLGSVFDGEVGQRVQADTANVMDTDASDLLVVDEDVRLDRRDG
ncbi:MAG: EthD family reductase [Haloarculaceae archaeon]